MRRNNEALEFEAAESGPLHTLLVNYKSVHDTALTEPDRTELDNILDVTSDMVNRELTLELWDDLGGDPQEALTAAATWTLRHEDRLPLVPDQDISLTFDNQRGLLTKVIHWGGRHLVAGTTVMQQIAAERLGTEGEVSAFEEASAAAGFNTTDEDWAQYALDKAIAAGELAAQWAEQLPEPEVNE